MTKLETFVEVLSVAMLTNDRSPSEQRAMLDLALELDTHRAAFLTSNRNPMPPTLVADVEATYDPSSGRRISLTATQRKKYDRLRAKWAWCKSCGYPKGVHGLDANDKPACPDAAALGIWNLTPHAIEPAA